MDIFIRPELYHYYAGNPLTLVDIGASGDLPFPWRTVSRFLRVIGFEPDQEAFNELVSKASHDRLYLNTALYKERTEVDFYVTRKREASSILAPDSKLLGQFPRADRFDVLEKKKIAVSTLDDELEALEVRDVDFIKLDTQGSELWILEGAAETLSNTFGLEIEVEFIEMYEGQPLFGAVDAFVREKGFQIVDLKRTLWKRELDDNWDNRKGQLVSGVALYVRTPGSLLELLTRLDDHERGSKALRSISICLLYNYPAIALALLHGLDGVLTASEHAMVKDNLIAAPIPEKHPSSHIPGFPGRARLARNLYAIYRLLQKPARKSRKRWWISGE